MFFGKRTEMKSDGDAFNFICKHSERYSEEVE